MLADLLGLKAQGALVRARFQSAELEKKNGQSRFMHALRSTTGRLLTEDGEIRQRAVYFYTLLYSSEFKENEELFDSFCCGLPRVSEETNRELGGFWY